MKVSKFGIFTAVGLALVLTVTGCHRKPKNLTDIPGRTAKVKDTAKPEPLPAVPGPTSPDKSIGGDGTSTSKYNPPPGSSFTAEPKPVETAKVPESTSMNNNAPPITTDSIPTAPSGADFDNYTKDPDFFKANTVYFEFDRSTIKASERVKVEEVALYLKTQTGVKLMVEGHCDERGTEEYNRALGERRALSLREYLVNLGISPERVYTISYGEDQPAVPGHNEAAWAKNRRGVFVLLKPKS